MRKYGLKLTLKNGKSSHDSSFVYPVSGEVVCPDADYKSKEPCGRGIHIALSLSGGLNYVPNPDEIRLVKLTGRLLGKDKDKARYDKCEVLCVLPDLLYENYRATGNPLDKNYRVERNLLDKNYRATGNPLDENYRATGNSLYENYQAKRNLLDKNYQAKINPLDKGFMRRAISYYRSNLAD